MNLHTPSSQGGIDSDPLYKKKDLIGVYFFPKIVSNLILLFKVQGSGDLGAHFS